MKLLIKFCFLVLIATNTYAENTTLPVELVVRAAKSAEEHSANDEAQISFLKGYQFGFLSHLQNEPVYKDCARDYHPAGWCAGFKQGYDDSIAMSHIGLDKFGYSEYAAVGKVTLNVEDFHFTPTGYSRGWWLSNLNQVTLENNGHYRVTGWLSPEGEYGYFGRSPRLLILLSAERANPGKTN